MQQQQSAEEHGLLGSLCPGQKKLEGKTFYLDSVKKRATALLLETISLLGGRVESFLHKDVSFVVTGSQEGLNEQKRPDTKEEVKETSDEAKRPIMTRDSLLSKQCPGTPRPAACGSRGKALLEKAIRNNERLKGSSVLANARSWGVKILYVDDMILYLKVLTRESFSAAPKKTERSQTKVKAAALRSPYLKIEDLSKKYRPLHMQSMTFPTLCYSGRFSPFESPPPPRFDKPSEKVDNKTREKKKVENSLQDKSQTALSFNPSPWRPRKKDLSYCECCHQPFTSLEEHLQSDQHRAFVTDLSNYTLVDKLIADMLPGFDPSPAEQPEETLNRLPSSVLMEDVCELEPLSDLETERAVQALQSFNAHNFSPAKDAVSPVHAGVSPGVQPFNPSPDTPPPDIAPFNHSLAMPVLDEEPQTLHLSSQQICAQRLSPYSDTLCPSTDPYSLPPVLSPHVYDPANIMEPQSLYSEPPVLSPQKFFTDKSVGKNTYETTVAESLPQSILAVSASFITTAALTNTETLKGPNNSCPIGLNEVKCSSDGLERASPTSHRSHSFPQCSERATNSKKRCGSASSDKSRSKKRRITEQGHRSSEKERDTAEKHKGCLLFDSQISQSSPDTKVSSTCTGETLGLKQTFTMFCVPAVQNFTQTLNQMDVSGHGNTSFIHQASSLPSSKGNVLHPSAHFPKDKSLSSQDSQRSHSLSTSVCIEPALIPDVAALSSSSSESDWDCELLSRLGPSSAVPLLPTEPSCELDKELLHRPCNWMHDSSYETRLHTVLQPSPQASSLCGEDKDASVFSRTVMQIVEVQH